MRIGGSLVSVAALFAGTLYSSSVVSHLTSPPIQPQPRTVHDLVNRGYHWSKATPLTDPSAILNVYDEWQKKFIQNYRPVEKMGPAIKNRKFAFYLSYIDDMFLYKEIPRIVYRQQYIDRLKEVIGHHSVGIGFYKGSLLTPHFSRGISRLLATGILTKMYNDMARWVRASRMSREQVELNTDSKPLSLAILQGAFFLFIGGQMAAFIVFTIEILMKIFKRIFLKKLNASSKIE